MLLVVSYSANADNSWQYKIASKALINEISSNLEVGKSTSGLVHALYLLKNKESDKKLIELSKYYLGSATGHELSACVTNRGLVVLPTLIEEIKNGQPCKENYCVKNITRLKSLNYWKGSIEKGIKIEFIE